MGQATDLSESDKYAKNLVDVVNNMVGEMGYDVVFRKNERGGIGHFMFKRDDGEALLGNPAKGFRAPWDNETDEEKAAKKAEREKNRYVPPPPPPGSTGIFGKEGLPRALDKALGIAKEKSQ